MKKLLCSAALAGLVAVAAAPAMAQGDQSALKLDLGGFFRGYVTYSSQDTAVGAGDERHIDILRDTEVHFTGETTLDNGLTVGVHIEAEADMGDGFNVDESYMYTSGSWGRVNFGGEDGAAYLLQVAAPSADSNVDGIRQYINPVNYDLMLGAVVGDTTFDYGQDLSGSSDKITYLSPVFNGFQAGVSYTPDTGDTLGGTTIDSVAFASRDLGGVSTDDVGDEYGAAWDVAARYEGQFDRFGLTLGAGFTHAELEEETTVTLDDREQWNVGAAVNFGGFGVGVVYFEDDYGVDGGVDGEANVLVLGADYTTGPWKVGASWYNREDEFTVAGFGADLDTDRYSGGVTYTYGPGMTFRGSVHYIDHEVTGVGDGEATSFLLGTQVNF
jgi:outer membrane protein OmpU